MTVNRYYLLGLGLKKLKEDYLTGTGAMDKTRSYVTYKTEIKEHVVGFSMNALNLTSLVYYTVEQEVEGEGKRESQTNEEIALCIFDNGGREGDLEYETVNFIAYLLKEYSPSGKAAQ